MPSILIVDDEPEILDLLRSYLERDGMTVARAADGEAALAAYDRLHPDLVLLDLMLPGIDGREVCRRIRDRSQTPIIMLTARDEETDKLVGFELGADDYITKPVSPREVVARVRAVLRRAQWAPRGDEIRAGDLFVDRRGHKVTRKGQMIDLTPTEFRLLEVLASHPGQVFTRMQLMDHLQGSAFDGYERTVDTHVRNLRLKIEPEPAHPRYVVTVYGIGYKFADQHEDV